MRTVRFLTVALLGLALWAPMVVAQSEAGSVASPLPPAPSASLGTNVKFNIEVGGEGKFISDGDRWSKFVEHRDIPDNFTINSLDFWWNNPNSRWSLQGHALDAGQLDQRYRLTLEKFGVSRSQFRFDSWPTNISRRATSPWTEITPGHLVIDPNIRQGFECAIASPSDTSCLVPPTGVTAVPPGTGNRDAAFGIINGLVDPVTGSAHRIDLQTRRQRFQFDQDFNLSRHWFVNAGAMYEWRRGHRPLGMGAYQRTAGPVGTGATWAAFSNELPQPLDFRTTEIRAAMGFKGEKAMVRFEYIGSWFFNNVKNLVFDNPFEAPLGRAASSGFLGPPFVGGGSCGGLVGENAADPFPPGFTPGCRWRFDQDNFYIAPDNRAHTFAVEGRTKLPGDSFFSALFAYQMRMQDSPFVPWTASTATFPGVPVDVNLPPGPGNGGVPSDLGGQVNTTTGNAVLGTRHWKELLLTARYRAFHYNNETPVIHLPGIIDMGSFWKEAFGSAAEPEPVAEFQVPHSYLRQNVTFEGIWRPSRRFHLRVAPFLETWNRNRRQVSRTNEFGGDTTVIVQPVNWINAKVTYRYANRDLQSPYIPALEEFVLLRDFDQAHRVINNPTVTVNFGGKGPWVVTANYSYLGQAYDQNFFGLGKYVRGMAGVDVNYAPSDRWGVAAYYNYDRIRYHYRQIAKEDGAFEFCPADGICLNRAGVPTGAVGSDEWDRETRDRVHSFGVAFNLQSESRKWQFSVNYDLSLATQAIRTFNPNPDLVFPIDAGGDALGHDFPDVHSNYQEVFADLGYAFRPNWQAGVRYIFSPYELQDFASDGLRPYMQTPSSSAPGAGLLDSQTDAIRYLNLDSRYDSFDAHMVAFYIRHWF